LGVPLLVLALSAKCAATDIEPTPDKYLRGNVTNDVATAIKRGAAEHRPIWIVAWDKAGPDMKAAHFALHYFYENPETKNLVAQNFVEVFTTFDDPAIAQWIGGGGNSHQPVYIVLDANGGFISLKPHNGNPDTGLKKVQEVSAGLGLKILADPLPANAVRPPVSADLPEVPTARRYLQGEATNDVAAALKRGLADHWPVWIVAWDKAFFYSADGREYQPAGRALNFFYEKPETKSLVSRNFIQVFTTLDDPDLAKWVDKNDRTHQPRYFVFDAAGNFVTSNNHSENPEWGLKRVQRVAEQLGITTTATDPAQPHPAPPVVPSKIDPNAVARIATQAPVTRLPPSRPTALPSSRQPAHSPSTAAPAPGPSTVQAVDVIAPILTAKTNLASRRIAQLQTGTTRIEQDNRTYSVDVSCRFAAAPPVPYEVQCFFISKNEATLARAIYDAVVTTGQTEDFRQEFVSQPLAGNKRTFTSMPFSSTSAYSDGSVGSTVGVINSYKEIKGQKVEGWIVRVVCQGKVLRVESNQPSLSEMANQLKPQLDAAIARVPRSAADDQGIK
jgi:hypothetical protein